MVETLRAVEALSECDIELGVVGRFQRVVQQQPDAVAVADSDHELTFAEVAAGAARVLAQLRSTVIGLNPPVAFHGPEAFYAAEPVATLYGHTPEAAVALLGVIASGHPLLVLDPRNPTSRMRQLMNQLGARVVVADQQNEATALDLTSDVIVPDRDGMDVPMELLWAEPPNPASVATVGFTSGSTGTPKAVAGDHRILVRDAWNSAIASGCYGADDVIAHTLPIAFNAGMTTTVHGLIVGATMRLFDARTVGIAGLPDFIESNRCTLMISSPGILRGLAGSSPDASKLASLRNLTIAGEVAYAADVAGIRPFLPASCAVRNRYGSTETTLISEYVMDGVPQGTAPLPIGSGVGRTRIDLVDESLTPVTGDQGRVAITAPNTTYGYWNNPEATAAVFRQNADGTTTYFTSDLGKRLPGGSIAITGRADHSVKIRGYLVDPGEVDAVLFGLPTVREAVTVAAPRPSDNRKRLVSYVAAAPGETMDEDHLRMAVRGALPAHMVPELFQFVDALPRNERGKIDRFSLPEPVEPVVEEDADFSLWEQHVAEEWAEVLEMDRVPMPHEDFFALGGDSLAAEALLARLVSNWNVSPEVASTGLLTESPKLRDFAARLQAGTPATNGVLVTFHTEGRRPPIFFVVGGGGLGVAYNYIARQFEDRPVYALQSPVIEGRGLPEYTMKQMVRRRLKELRRIQPHGPYNIAGHSFGGLLAFEMAQQLKAAGEQVNLMILDAFAPDPSLHPEAEIPGTVERVKRRVRLAKVSVANSAGGSQWYKFFEQATTLGLRYHGRPWYGQTLVVVAQTPEKAVRSAWGPFLKGTWNQVEVSGDHRTMLRAPEADETVAAIKDYLAAVEPADLVIDLRDTPRQSRSSQTPYRGRHRAPGPAWSGERWLSPRHERDLTGAGR